MADSPSDTSTTQQPLPAETPQAAQQANTGDTSITAGAPPADSGESPAEPISLDQVIKATIEKGLKPAADSQSDGKPDQPTDKAEDQQPGDAEKRSDAEDDANVPVHKHPRWQQKLKLERELKAKVSEYEKRLSEELEPLKGQVEGLKHKAENLDQIGSFMRDNGLTPQEMSEGFQVMALMKNNPSAALEMLLPKIELLELATGKRLPDDIRSLHAFGDTRSAPAGADTSSREQGG